MASEFRLLVPNDERSVGIARGFVQRVAEDAGMALQRAQLLAEATESALRHTIRYGYPENRSDEIELAVTISEASLELRIRDNGVPEIPNLPELGALASHSWSLLGYGGKALVVTEPLPTASPLASPRLGLTRETGAPAVDAGAYVIRRLEPRDAPAVARLVYRVYGHTYDDEDYYFPDRIVNENADGAMVSIVAQHPDGEIVGHYALERREPPTIYEGSSAVVNPDHRGRGLMERMRAAAMQEAKAMSLAGVMFLPWTVHTVSQHANETFGAKVVAANLSDTSPTAIKGFESESMAQRVSTLLYFAPLQLPEERVLHAPASHRAIISDLYRQLGWSFRFADGGAVQGEGAMTIRELPHDRWAEIYVGRIGEDTAHLLETTTRRLLAGGHETIYLSLPMAQAGTPAMAEIAQRLDFGFLGIGPGFAEDGDTLRLGLITQPLDASHIHVLSPFAQRLVDYVLADVQRGWS